MQSETISLNDQTLSASQQADVGESRNWQTAAMQMMQRREAEASTLTTRENSPVLQSAYPQQQFRNPSQEVSYAGFQQPRNASSDSLTLPPIGNQSSPPPAPPQRQMPQSRPQASYLPPVHAAPVKRAADESGIYIQPEMQVHQNRQRRPESTYTRQAAYSPAQQAEPTPAPPRQQATATRVAQNYQAPQAARLPNQNTASSRPGSFTRRNDSMSKFRQIQLSSESLIHRRGPGLQDRIASMLSKPRYNAEVEMDVSSDLGMVSTRNVAAENRPRPQQVAKVRRIPKRSQQTLNRTQRSSQQLAQANRQQERQPPRKPRYDKPQRTRQVAQADNSLRQRNRSSEADSSRIAQVAMTQAAVDPVQDPFGDYPPLRPADDGQGERYAFNQDGPVSILNRPRQKRKQSQMQLPRSRSIDSYSDPQFDYAPSSQDDESSGDFGGGAQELPDPSGEQDAFDELESAFGDDEAARPLDGLEELPEDPADRDTQDDEDEDTGDIDLENLDDDFEDDLDDETPKGKSCEEFRNQLLNNPISTISLDISPPKSGLQTEYALLSRTWRDNRGNILATGTMRTLSRGYVILDDGQKLPYARLSDSDLAAISEFWKIPAECTIGNSGFAGRNWAPQTFTWKASSLCHKPLYFENIQLERYGHSHGPFLQPVQSVTHFFTSLVTLPYQTSIHPPNECQYALGYYRPGNCAPWLKDPIPISLDGIKRQLEISTGMAFIP